MHPTLKRRSWGGNLGSMGKNVSRIERIVHNLMTSVCLSFFLLSVFRSPKLSGIFYFNVNSHGSVGRSIFGRIEGWGRSEKAFIFRDRQANTKRDAAK